MSYEAIEEEIYQRLLPLEGANIEIVKLPENQKDFERPFEKSKITVGYKGSKWDKPRSTAQISQNEELMFEFSLQARRLRGSKGVYNLKDILKVALIGFQPVDCDRMYAHESGMTGVATLHEGVWTYSCILCTSSLTVEDFEEDLSVILKKITSTNTLTGDVLIVESETP